MDTYTEQYAEKRLRILIGGAVQGVGFRPFIYRLATSLNLTGWVSNSTEGVVIEAEGTTHNLETFLLRIGQEKPPLSSIHSFEHVFLDMVSYRTFEIRQSQANGDKRAFVVPDIATCPECLKEIFDPANRRYRYPFTNCTHCGPRFSIIQALPYDRPNTTMHKFTMCVECQAEYENPVNRRFHAQPNACPRCGPHLELWNSRGDVQAEHDEALVLAANAIGSGAVVAIKGLGGFHLVVDARNPKAVARLRKRKHREEKPFGVMYPSLALIKNHCEVSPLEETLLTSPECPIVLLRRKTSSAAITSIVGPGNPYLGVMLPFTPLHHLLMAELNFPIVATSGNLSDEPICIDEFAALERLRGIADVFLVHDRPIARHVDDSVARVIMDRPVIVRRARGYAPLPIHISDSLPPILATGAHLKNTVAISKDGQIFISQHIGDLETTQAFEASRRAAADLQSLYDHKPAAVACDLHPDYLSTQLAEQTAQALGVPVIRVQHHYAHVRSCMIDNEIDSPVLGVSWDGTGYGTDGTIWGGEFLRIPGQPRAGEEPFDRVAHLETFALPGGDKAVREPRRTALGLLYELYGDEVFSMGSLAPVRAFDSQELAAIRWMLDTKLNSPRTSSAGRLFDAVASILDLAHQSSFEGQAAMQLEFAIGNGDRANHGDHGQADGYYAFELLDRTNPARTTALLQAHGLVVDWSVTIRQILDDVLHHHRSTAEIAARFHNSLAEMIVAVARRIGEERVVLTGGCFQNRYLSERTIQRLSAEGFRPYWHQRIPPNDGGIAPGQIAAAAIEYRARH